MPAQRPYRKPRLSRRNFLKGSAALLLTSSVGYLNRLRLSLAQESGRADVLVLGAGAAGLSAAQSLRHEGLSVTVLEARQRLGGRIWSDDSLAPYPIELGAEFIHGSRAAIWGLLKQAQLTSLKDEGEAVYVYLSGLLQPADALERDYLAELEEALDLWDEEADEPLSAVLPELGLSGEEARLLNSFFAPDNAADLDQYSVLGYAEATFEDDGAEEGDWRIAEGYSALVDFMGSGLDVRLNSVVQRIFWDSSGVEVQTSDGRTCEADKLIITLPLGVLQKGSITFDPALPTWKQHAIRRLGAGIVNKLILKFREPFWPNDLSVLVTPLDTQFWWRPGFDRSEESPILTALIGGRSGADFSEMSEPQAVERGLADLERMAGRSLGSLLLEGRFVNWGADPYSLMGYSYTPVGAAGVRAELARAVDDVLYFAGEATNSLRPGTVHGAVESGETAARALLAVWR